MDASKFKAMLRRRLPYPTIVIQCDEDTTPPEIRARGMVCAILTWVPEHAPDGAIVAEGFTATDAAHGEERVEVIEQPRALTPKRPYREPPLSDQPANEPPKEDDDDPNRSED